MTSNCDLHIKELQAAFSSLNMSQWFYALIYSVLIFLWSAENKYSGTVVHFGPVVMIKLTEFAEQERLDEQQSRA